MDIKQVMKFNGTASRTNFWVFQAIGLGFFYVLIPAMAVSGEAGATFAAVLLLLGLIPFTWAGIAVSKARFNEAGWSGWWMLMPIVNIVVPGFFGPEEKDES